MRKILTWVAGIILLIIVFSWIVSNPAGSGSAVHGFIMAIVTFATHLGSG